MGKTRNQISSQWLPIAFAIGLSGCAIDTSPAVVKDCVLPSDQVATLSGRWPVSPVPIALKAGQFTSDEASQILSAASTWNGFFEASLGIDIVDPGGPNVSSASRPSSVCSQGIIQNGQFSGQVVIYKEAKWNHTGRNTIALTTFCPSAAKPVPNFYAAIIELNYENFWANGKKQPDLNSILVHELGHLIGLNHSCGATTTTGFPNCASPSLPSDYFDAVMYPVVLFDGYGYGQQRRALQANDQGRANCLYKDLAGN